MREIWRHRGMRLIFTANLISMIGSGMNSAAVTWYILQATHSEVSLGIMIALMTLPTLALLPLTGVIIDRNDRRHLMMGLDAARGAVIFTIAILALTHRVHLWEVYAMTMVVSVGFWMFLPTMNALVQELTPEDKLIDSNSLMLAAFQGGWMMAGAVVGFMYNHIGLSGVLLIDTATYAISIACVFQVRKGRVIVAHPERQVPTATRPDDAFARYFHEMREGYEYVAHHRPALMLGIAWALFIAAMMTQGVLTAPLSDRILHAGAVGYGWLNGGWAIGALVSVVYASHFIRRFGAHRSVTITMSVIALSQFFLPASRWLAIAVPVLFLMGSSRGVGGIAISSEMMEMVPKHFMGRVQNTFFFLASGLQIFTSLLAGEAAHREGLRYAYWLVGLMYVGAAVTASWPVQRSVEEMAPGQTAAD
jgi:MFS family permease